MKEEMERIDEIIGGAREIAPKVAELMRVYHDAFVKAGFREDQAMSLLNKVEFVEK